MTISRVFPEKYKYVYQICISFAANIFHVATVMSFGWTSPSLPKLLAPDVGPFQITVEQGTWIVSCMKLGQLIGPIPSAWAMDRLGRKRTTLLLAVMLLTGWFMVGFAERFELICVFTFLAGFTISGASVVLPMYTAEISSPHIRGLLGMIHAITGKMGILLIFAIGPFTSVRLMAWLCTIPVVIFIAVYYWLPESPYHLIAIENHAKAEVSLQKLRCSLDVKEELAQMKKSVKESQENRGTFHELFFNRRNRRSMVLLFGLSALIELCGSQIVLQYAQTILGTLNSGLDSNISSIIFGVVQLVAVVLACFLVDTMGRRPLMLLSIVGSGVCTLLIGIYYILDSQMDVSGFGWIAVVALMAFMVSYSIGILALMPVIISELFPKNLKSVAGATMGVNASWIGLALVYGFQYGVDVWGSGYVFLGFSLITFAFVPFIMILLPETKRQTLDEILEEK